MSMSKTQMVFEIDDMHRRMRLLMALSGVTRMNVFDLPAIADNFRADFIRPGFHWLRDIFETEFKELNRIWKQTSESLWNELLADHDSNDFKEVRKLRAHMVILKKKMNHGRPKLFLKRQQDHAAKMAVK